MERIGTALTRKQWSIERPAWDNRLFSNAVFWILRAGMGLAFRLILWELETCGSLLLSLARQKYMGEKPLKNHSSKAK